MAISSASERLAAPQNLERGKRASGRKIPPEELHEVQPFDPEPRKRTVDDRLDLVRAQVGKAPEVGHELGMNAHPVGDRSAAAAAGVGDEGPDHLLDALVDVGAVKGGDPGVQKRLHVGDGRIAVDGAVIARQLPAALDDTGDPVARAQPRRFDHGHWPPSFCQ